VKASPAQIPLDELAASDALCALVSHCFEYLLLSFSISAPCDACLAFTSLPAIVHLFCLGMFGAWLAIHRSFTNAFRGTVSLQAFH
jgi:hypothetical protein